MKAIFRYFLLIQFLIPMVNSYGSEVVEREIIIKDHKFHPEITQVPSGHKIRLIIKNNDSTIEEFDSIDLSREKIIPGNSLVHVILAPLKPGKYCFMGEFHPETASGCIIVNDGEG